MDIEKFIDCKHETLIQNLDPSSGSAILWDNFTHDVIEKTPEIVCLNAAPELKEMKKRIRESLSDIPYKNGRGNLVKYIKQVTACSNFSSWDVEILVSDFDVKVAQQIRSVRFNLDFTGVINSIWVMGFHFDQAGKRQSDMIELFLPEKHYLYPDDILTFTKNIVSTFEEYNSLFINGALQKVQRNIKRAEFLAKILTSNLASLDILCCAELGKTKDKVRFHFYKTKYKDNRAFLDFETTIEDCDEEKITNEVKHFYNAFKNGWCASSYWAI